MENPTDERVDGWLDEIRISSLCEWDVLVFLDRHNSSLATAREISQLLGYDTNAVGEALDALVLLGLAQRTRSTRGVLLYEVSACGDGTRGESLDAAILFSRSRKGRLAMARRLRARGPSSSSETRSGLHLAPNPPAKKEAKSG